MLMDRAIAYRRLRAPRRDGEALIEPPLDRVGELIAQNRRRRSDYDFSGRSLSSLANEARRELLREANRYTAGYRDLAQQPSHTGDDAPPVFLAGHQPLLFHPGVWFKNFALDNLAAAHAGIGVNLLIDSDTIKSAAVRVPSGTKQQPFVESIPLDGPSAEIPFEQRGVLDRQTFEMFGRRAAEAIRPLVPHPIVEQLWPLAVERMHSGQPLGGCLSQSRHQLEGVWGLETLELPQSWVCRLESFAWFAAHLLAQLPRFWEIHNHALGEYRRANRLRSRAHPVPDLASDDDWLEAPFWIWTDEDPARRRLFVRGRSDQLVLSDRHQWTSVLDLSPDGPADRAVSQLMEFAAQGIKLRTRALGTTMFARLLLGDVFLHGIGGAKYDQLTDALIQRFFGLEPPGFMILSATFCLPIPREQPSPARLREIRHSLRDLAFHAERFAHPGEASSEQRRELEELIATKQRWAATPKTPQNARSRHLEIARVNELLQPWVENQRKTLLAERVKLTERLRAEAVLGSREYAFCLYPEKTFRELILDLLRAKS